MLSAPVDQWCPETHSFHLSCREATVTLRDVTTLLELPIDNHPMCGLLGMRAEDHREFHDKAPPRATTFTLFIIINIPLFASQERTNFVEEP
jgi:hypothetical protein